jgi:hypothetical protein
LPAYAKHKGTVNGKKEKILVGHQLDLGSDLFTTENGLFLFQLEKERASRDQSKR